MNFPAGYYPRAFAQRIGDMLLYFGDRFLVNQRPDGDVRLQAIADLQLTHRLLKLFGETIVDAILDVQAVGADAGLPGVAKLGGQRAFDGFIQIGVVKNDKRRVAAELQRDLLDIFRALFHQLAANFRRAGKREFAHQRVTGELIADFAGRSGDHVKHALGDPGAVGELRQRQRGERGLAGGLEHHRAACGQRRTRFTGDHRRGKIPRGDSGGYANRLFNHQQPLVGLMAGNGIAVDTLALFGKPLDKGGGVADFTFCFRQRFTLFQRHQARQIVLMLHHQLKPAAQDSGAFFGGKGAPCGQRAGGGIDSLAGFCGAHFGHAAQLLAVGGVRDREGLFAAGVAPASVNQRLLAKKGRVVKLHGCVLS